MAAKHDIDPVKRVEDLLVELSEAKLRRADAFTDARLAGERSAEDARMRAAWLMANGDKKYRARDVEVIRVELAVALKRLGIDYPQPET